METIHPDWKEFLQLLNFHEAKYLVVGGHALAFHGHPRYTQDLDCFVLVESTNAQRVLDALRDFGFGSAKLTIEQLQIPSKVFMLGKIPFRIDLLNEITGVSFEDAWNSRVRGTLGQVPVWFIGREMLVKNKLASARPKDLADVNELSS